MSLYKALIAAIDYWGRRSGLECIRTHTVYTRELGPDSTIVDLGANVGDFTRMINELFDCTCFCVEAIPALCSQIPTGPKIHKFNMAVSDRNGPLELFTSSNRECNSIYESIAGGDNEVQGVLECQGTTLEGFLKDQKIGWVDLLKLDIEGAEKQVFDSTSDGTIRGIKQITIEFHDFIPDSISEFEVKKICDRLKSLGFLCIPASYIYPDSKHADLLFINMSLCKVPVKDRIGFGIVRALLNAESFKSGLKAKLNPPNSTTPQPQVS